MMLTESEEARLKLYEEAHEKFPQVSAPQRLPLNFATGRWV